MTDTPIARLLRSDAAAIVVGALIGGLALYFVLGSSSPETSGANDAPDFGPGIANAATRTPAPTAAPPSDIFGEPAAADTAGDPRRTSTAPQAPARVVPPAGSVQVVHTTLKGSMPGSFRAAIGERRLGDAVAATWARLFMWDLDLRRGLWPGDGLSAAFVVEDDEAQTVVIEGARLNSQKLRREISAYRFHATGDDYPSYWSADGTELPFRLVDTPVEDYEQITSLLRDRPNHKGMDFMAPVGTPVVAPYAGTVRRVNWNRAANGLCVEIERPDGSLLKFLHLDSVDVGAGARVKPGQRIGRVGNTGRSTGPHLHYQIDKNGRTLDPIDVHGTRRRTLPDADRKAFAAQVSRVDRLLDEKP